MALHWAVSVLVLVLLAAAATGHPRSGRIMRQTVLAEQTAACASDNYTLTCTDGERTRLGRLASATACARLCQHRDSCSAWVWHKSNTQPWSLACDVCTAGTFEITPNKNQDTIAGPRDCDPRSVRGATHEFAIIVGGRGEGSERDVMVWDPQNTNLHLPHDLTTIADFYAGHAFFINGSIVAFDDDQTATHDISSANWTAYAGPAEDVSQAAAVLLPDGAVVVPRGAAITRPLRFTVTGGWEVEELGELAEPLRAPCAVYVADTEEIVVTGGGPSTSVKALTTDARVKATLPPLADARYYHMCSPAMYNGTKGILVVGGYYRILPGSTGYLSSVEFLRYPGGIEWQRLPDLPLALSSGKIAVVNNEMYLFGGVPSYGQASNKVFHFDNWTGNWSEAHQMLKAKEGHAVAVASG